MIFLDTNVAIHFHKQSSAALNRRIEENYSRGENLVLSPIVLQELEVGILRSANPGLARARHRKFMEFISSVVPLDADDALMAGRVRHELQINGSLIGAYDLLIAAQALSRGALLVTNNTREFSRVSGLRWADWMAE